MWRIGIGIFLFLLSLLVLFRAPTNFLWRVSVAVTEFPYLFFFAALLLFISSFWSLNFKTSSLLLSGISFFIFLIPVFSAYQKGGDLESKLSSIFPSVASSTQLQSPFSFLKMFSGIGIQKNNPETFVYKKADDKNLVIDFYSGSKNKKAPCIIVIHGGSWSEGDEKQLPDLNYYLANRGYNVAAISYRLAPRYKSPAPVEDTKDALHFLVENSEKLNIDTTNFVLLGRSAGGQIALVSAYTFRDEKIKGVINFYGPADMVWGATIPSNKWVLDVDKVFSNYLGGLLKDVPEKYHESSACECVHAGCPPTLLIHGKNDAMVAFDHETRLQKKLNEFQVKNFFLDLSYATHGCDYNINGPSGQLSTFVIERFISSVTSK